MTRFIKGHETYLAQMMNEGEQVDLKQLADYHLIQIGFLQHERLIHLWVTLAFALFLIMALVVTWLFPTTLLFVLDVILLVVILCYILHYYKLENTVQRWYGKYNEICKIIDRPA